MPPTDGDADSAPPSSSSATARAARSARGAARAADAPPPERSSSHGSDGATREGAAAAQHAAYVPVRLEAAATSTQPNARCWYASGAACTTGSGGSPAARCSTMCAIVPLKPNELTLVHGVPATANPCAGSANGMPRNRSPTSGLSARSCALPANDSASSCRCTLSSPIWPDTASLWPTLAFAAPTASGSARPATPYTAPRAPASVGSPSAVPVPCSSTLPASAAPTAAPPSAARSRPRCADPFGAVRLAERPSCRTALPRSAGPAAPSTPGRSTSAPTPSERA